MMHKLDRTGITPPNCLTDYDHNTQRWDDLASACKSELRAALVSMQGQPGVTTPDASEHGLRCAYCESQIFADGHIEHFRRKNERHYPELTFDWNNLFLACGSNTHCGHYKDRKGAPDYNPDRIIKPDEHEPDDYLFFHSSGEVRARSGLNETDNIRAAETIRVFGLNDRGLMARRARTISAYKNRIIAEIDELATWSSKDRQAYLADEIRISCYHPYATTIKHFLLSVT